MFVPHVYLSVAAEVSKGSPVEIGGQNMYIEDKGAFTGAVSGGMIKSSGAAHVRPFPPHTALYNSLWILVRCQVS